MRRYLLFLKDIINAMNKIFNYTENMTKEDFKKDDKTIDAVLRNIVIHEYFGVDLNIIWQIVTVNLPETKPKIENIFKIIGRRYLKSGGSICPIK